MLSLIFLLISMNSHGIKLSHDEDGTDKGATRPQVISLKSGFIQAPAFIETRDPARGRADIPPGGARSWSSPEMGRGRRIKQWQQLDPSFPFQGNGKQMRGRASGKTVQR